MNQHAQQIIVLDIKKIPVAPIAAPVADVGAVAPGVGAVDIVGPHECGAP